MKAEDEFIWPVLKAKQVDISNNNGSHDSDSFGGEESGSGERAVVDGRNQAALLPQQQDQQQQYQHQDHQLQQRERAHSVTVHRIEQEEYEEDHADEEKMFNSINEMLSKLREELLKRRNSHKKDEALDDVKRDNISLQNTAKLLLEGTGNLMHHLISHLNKEESHCMPLVAQYLTKGEINDLVGKIMGKRSSELMSQILTMAVQNLDEQDRDDMVKYMKQAMVGTFFERWLKMSGLGEREDGEGKCPHKRN